MRVLVACECSQKVCKAFRRRSIEAFSCDIQDCYGGHPEWHIKGDCLQIINDGWDLVIAHPPCTYLSKVQSPLIFKRDSSGASSVSDYERFYKAIKASIFFRRILECSAPFVCVENPIMLRCFAPRPPDCVIQPFEFGHPFSKATCLWLKNLPPLMPTLFIPRRLTRSWVPSVPGFSKNTKWKVSRLRSETFDGVADAIAEQYGRFVFDRLSRSV